MLQFYQSVEASSPGRLLVGLGAPQRPRALAALDDYLDELDAAEDPAPQGRRILAAIGPRKLDMARDRFAGAVPIRVTPAYTATARERLGPDRVLAIGQCVVIDANPTTARETARVPLRFLLGIRGYADSARRLGFTSTDIDTVSDRLPTAAERDDVLGYIAKVGEKGWQSMARILLSSNEFIYVD